MKTLRLTVLSLIAAASTAVAFAAPSAPWSVRRAANSTASITASTPAVTAPAANSKCDSMVVKQGKRTSTVKCEGPITETAKCKAMCGS